VSSLRAAVIGVGYLGNFHAQKYKNNSNVTLIGVCDPRPEQAQKIAGELKVQAFTNAKDLIGKVDLVTIAATTSVHYELAKMFLENGIHVNVEKPIAVTVRQAEELVELASRKKLKLAVGHIERFNPAILELKKHLKSPKTIQLTRWAPYKPRGADVSVLHDLMIHDIDLMFWLTQDNKVKNWMAKGSKILTQELDTAEASFEMSNGCLVHISVNRMAATTVRQIQAIQSDCTLVANTGTLQMERVDPINPKAEPALKITNWAVEKADALQRETDAFIECVKSNSTPAVTGEDGLLALRWVEDIQSRILKNS
jgi:predicted dehydrogenase